jgi:hypothetical protein
MPSAFYLRAWLTAFIFTEIVEVPIYSRFLPCSLLVAFGASAFTHPIVWFGFFTPHWHAHYIVKAVAAELFAWLAEAAYFAFIFKKKNALLWSLVANASSLGLGLLSRHLFGAP